MTSRQSLGGRFAPVTKSNSRQSLAPNGSASTSAASRQSFGGRQSLAPSASSSSRQSLAPSSSRQSLGGRNALIDRKSGGGRRSSGAGTQRGVRTDPRPITSKEFVKENIRKLILYLTTNNYTHTLTQKQLSSPSTKDFQYIITFLFQQIDLNFQFPDKKTDPNALSFEDSVKMYMKRFGYPFAISKNALQAAGSPHTWPSLLAMLVWLTEFLQYHQVAHDGTNANGGMDGFNGAMDSEQKMFFEYVSGAYRAFLQGADDYTQFDDALAAKFQMKNAAVTEEVKKLQRRITDAQADISVFKDAAARLEEYSVFVRDAKRDIPVLEENIQHNRAHMQVVQQRKAEREEELLAKTAQLKELQIEHERLTNELAAQPFTPLQVQEMLHQKSTLETTLENQRQQAQNLQSETWKAELEAAKVTSNIEKLLSELNSIGLDVAAGSRRSTHPYRHEEIRFQPQGEKVEHMLNVDLKKNKEDASIARDAVIQSKRELTLESKKKESMLAHLSETQAERVGSVEILSKRLVKLSDVYASERLQMNRIVEESCAQVEDVELDIVRLRNALTGGVEKVPSSALAAIDQELQRSEAIFLQEESTLKAEICAIMQELTEHKVAVQERLEQMLEQAEAIKQELAATEIKKSQ